MEEKTLRALRWIIGILDAHDVPYWIGGGFAAHIYGAKRPLNDIDITLPGSYFPIIIPEVSPYITAEPKHYSDAIWDCNGFSLDYFGQEIDITDIETLRMSDKKRTGWFRTKDHFRKFPNIVKKVDGIDVSLIDPRDLVSYKKHLDGNHQIVDIAAVQEYIRKQIP
ncbi:MAG: hypothetical protein HGA31_05715 [Candidatus Moranbacteria bacterium]|nr:hypothetical protein [Candidatus Moranbacteria bacterium]